MITLVARLRHETSAARMDVDDNVTTAPRWLIDEAAQRIEELEVLLRELIDGGHIYGNDAEQWLVKAEAALAKDAQS